MNRGESGCQKLRGSAQSISAISGSWRSFERFHSLFFQDCFRPSGFHFSKRQSQGRTLNKRVLFISHEASRTGAPIVLLHFLRWFKRNTDIPFMVLVRESRGAMGELLQEFDSLGPLFMLNGERSSFNGFFKRS